MNKTVKLVSVLSMLFFVSISYGKPKENPSCFVCREYGGLSIKGKPLMEENLKLDPIYKIVLDKNSQEKKDAYLKDLMYWLTGDYNVPHCFYHFASAVLAGANVNTQSFGSSLLKYVIHDNPETEVFSFIKFLLEHGADPNIRLGHMGMPLMGAKTECMVSILLAHGALVIEGFPLNFLLDHCKQEEREKINILLIAALAKQKAVAAKRE